MNNQTKLSFCRTEILRFHPIFPFLFRSCTEEYTIPGSNLKLEKGVSVAVPISAIHKDPEIFPNPHVFDPDRFLLDQDNSIYMPFGFGQRICPGIFYQLHLIYASKFLFILLLPYKIALFLNNLTKEEMNILV